MSESKYPQAQDIRDVKMLRDFADRMAPPPVHIASIGFGTTAQQLAAFTAHFARALADTIEANPQPEYPHDAE